MDVEYLERFHQLFHRVDAGHSGALEQGVDQVVGAGQRGGVGEHHLLRGLRAADLDGDDRLAHLPGDRHGGLERQWVRHAFDVEPDGRHPFLAGEGADGVVEVELELVAEGQHIGDRQSPPLHGEVERDVGRHRDEGDAGVDPAAALLVGPEHRAVDVVQHAVAVRADERHLAARLP